MSGSTYMDTVMDALIPTVIGLALTGLTILAYRHPAGYARIFPYLYKAGCVIVVLATAWNLGAQFGGGAAETFVPFGKFAAAEASVRGQQVPWGWLLGTFLAFEFYVIALMGLPSLLGTGTQRD